MSNRLAAPPHTMGEGLLHTGVFGSGSGGVVAGQGTLFQDHPPKVAASPFSFSVLMSRVLPGGHGHGHWHPGRLHTGPMPSKRYSGAALSPPDLTFASASTHANTNLHPFSPTRTPKSPRTLPDSTALAALPTTATTPQGTSVSSYTQPSTGKVACSLAPSAPPPFCPWS